MHFTNLSQISIIIFFFNLCFSHRPYTQAQFWVVGLVLPRAIPIILSSVCNRLIASTCAHVKSTPSPTISTSKPDHWNYSIYLFMGYCSNGVCRFGKMHLSHF